MANPKIQVDITGDATDLKKAAKEAEKAVAGIDDKVAKVDGKGLDDLGKNADKAGDAIRGLAQDNLGPLGQAADMAGVEVAGLSTGMLAAGAAAVAAGKFAESSVRTWYDLVERVRAFQMASGASWEDSSRLVEVFGDLGVEADAGAAAMARLGKSIEADKLAQYGIQVRYASDGTVDMAATLGAVADQFVATTDPAQRAAMASDIFGKSWLTLAPILSRGSAGIDELTSSVGKNLIVSKEMDDQQRELKEAAQDLSDSWTELQVAAGSYLVPVLIETVTAMNELISGFNETKSVGEGVQQMLIKTAARWGIFGDEAKKAARANHQSTDAMNAASEAAVEAYEAYKRATPQAQALARASAELADQVNSAAKASEKQKKRLDEANAAVMTAGNKALELREAQARVADAVDDYTAAQEDANEAASTYGANSPQAVKANRDVEKAVRDHTLAAQAAAKATVEQTAEQEALNDRILTAEDKNWLYIKSLEGIRDGTNDPVLRAGMDELITAASSASGQVERLASALYQAEQNYSRLATIAGGANIVPGMGIVGAADRMERAAGVGGYTSREATGGNVAGGSTYMVGEAGPEMFVPQSNGRILTADDLARVGPGGGGGLTINVNTPIGRPDDVVRWLREELRRADRAQR